MAWDNDKRKGGSGWREHLRPDERAELRAIEDEAAAQKAVIAKAQKKHRGLKAEVQRFISRTSYRISRAKAKAAAQ